MNLTIKSSVSLLAMGLLLGLGCQRAPQDDAPWQDLFNGTDLSGWTQKGGQAIYTVREGAIVGSTVHDTPNSEVRVMPCADSAVGTTRCPRHCSGNPISCCSI